MNTIQKVLILIFSGTALFCQTLQAQIFESAGSGNWVDAQTWVNGAIPPSNTQGITIVINEGHHIHFHGNAHQHRIGNKVNVRVEHNI